MIATLEDMCKKIVFTKFNVKELNIPNSYKKEYQEYYNNEMYEYYMNQIMELDEDEIKEFIEYYKITTNKLMNEALSIKDIFNFDEELFDDYRKKYISVKS